MTPEPSPYDSVCLSPGHRPQPKGAPSLQPAPALRPAPAAKVADAKGPSGPAAGEPVKFTTGKAADICERFLLSEQAALYLTGDVTPWQYIDLLTEKNLYPDAVRVLAHGLPKREAVWWACLCLREALGANPREKIKLALEAAEKWAKRPTEENRRDGLKAAETAGFGTPAGMTAMAAFWSSGSLAPPEAPVVPPADDLTAGAVAGAVLLTAIGSAPDEVPKRHRRFLALGLAVACGR
jgi:hypothetical protein